MEKTNIESILINYVKAALNKGVSKEEIKEEILRRGYPRDIAERAIKKATQDKKKVYFYVAFLIILVIGIGITIFLINNNNNSPTSKAIINITAKLETCITFGQMGCQARLERNSSLCDIIPNKSEADICKDTISMMDYFENIFTTRCENLDNGTFKFAKFGPDIDISHENCIELLNAIESTVPCKSPFCNEISKSFIAPRDGNISLCDEIEDYTRRSDCKMLISKNLSYCNYNYYKCYDAYNMGYAMIMVDLSYCEKIIKDKEKSNCYDSIKFIKERKS